MTDPAFDYIPFRGAVVDRKTAGALELMEYYLGYELTVIKGHDVAGMDSVSASTHNQGGVVDLAPYDAEGKLKAAKLAGFGGYIRDSSEGPWSPHLHLMLLRHENMDPLARSQISDYLSHPPRNGLSNHALDNHPWRPDPLVFFSYDSWRKDLRRLVKIKGLMARIDKITDRISALRAKRKTYRAQVKAAKNKQTYLH